MLLKRKRIPSEPRRLQTTSRARDFIVRDTEMDSLPIDPFELYEKCGWLLLTWTEAKRVLNSKDPLLLKKTGAEARTSIIRGTDQYITVYDDTITPPTRIRWTIAHEIGHIVLRHLITYDKTAINRGGLQPSEYDVLEKEADMFAAELLTPHPILNKLGIIYIHDIQTLCKVSYSASINIERSFRWGRPLSPYYDKKLMNQFYSFISRVITCCGKSSVELMPVIGNIRRGAKKMDVISKLDENGRFINCPQCGNVDFSEHAIYCKMCSLKLFNNCLNEREFYDDGCGRINPGDARYCEYCGVSTYLLNQNLLTPWDKLSTSIRKI